MKNERVRQTAFVGLEHDLHTSSVPYGQKDDAHIGQVRLTGLALTALLP